MRKPLNSQLAGTAAFGRMTNFDGLRGLGIIIVILYHMEYSLFKSGWICISYFFSLSGFLITAMTLRRFEITGSIDVLRFWSLRIGRLFPAFFFAICLCAFSRFFRVEDEKELYYERNDLLYGVAFLTNYNLIYVRKDDYFAGFTYKTLDNKAHVVISN